MLLTGAEILVKSLLNQGVDTVFGYPGGAVLNIYDYLYKYKEQIKHYLTCHEQGAAHAADGYARSSGKVGVCIATSGPGATNLVTGIATAYMDSVPLVAITGNVQKSLLGRDSFQEVDITGITMPITKHNFIIKDINNLEETIRKAFYIAKEGRPGPVLIDIPKDITSDKTEYKGLSPLPVEPKSKHITVTSLNEAAKYINDSEKPLIYAGGGVINSDATEELINFAEKINAPVATTLMCRGAIPSEHRLNTGMIGMHGSNASNILATKCDLIIALGARFSDRVISDKEFINNAKIIQIDVDPAEINKNVRVDSFIIGDIKVALQKLMPLINEKRNENWLKTVEELKLLSITKNNSDDGEQLTPRFLFEKLSSLDDGSFVMTTEVGQHQMWTAQYFNFKTPRTLISSGGLGTMGFGLGAAIGVKVASPNKTVFNNLKGVLPQNFLKVVFEILGLSEIKASDLKKEDEYKVIEYMKEMKLTARETLTIKAAQVTSGGVKVKEINASTMESKLIKNLYFAGEVIDVDAETGGYNLQIAFSTGYLAGMDY